MEIVFGLDADGLVWPATTNGAAAEAGGLVTGPAGLLRVVEAALGLGAPAVPVVKRLARWRAKLAAADAPARFWHASFATDPFATARLLLGWRDALVEAGWTADALPTAPARLRDMADAERAGPSLPASTADCLQRAITALRDDPPPEPIMRRLRLLDPRPLLPPGLGRLIDVLEQCGTVIEAEEAPMTAAIGDLGTVQGVLRGLGIGAIADDGRFTLLEAETESAAAELLADMLAALPNLDGLTILATRPTSMLDAALRRRHLPRLGFSPRSPLRGILQVLPLVFAIRWQPFDARSLVELLQLPRCPIPREVRRQLLFLLPETPGRGGAKWHHAIAEGLTELRSRLELDDPDRASERIASAEEAVAIWLESPPADPDSGLPVDALLRACGALARWAQGQAASGVPLAAILAAHAVALAEAVRESGLAVLPRSDLERLIDTILAEGEADPEAPAEAAAWGIASAPGAVWQPVARMIWWGFDAPTLPADLPWTDAEQAALAEGGCLPWQPANALSAASLAWRRPILAARQQAILVSIRAAGTEAHPISHELEPLLDAHQCLRPRAESLVGLKDPVLAGTTLPRQVAGPLALPVARATWRSGSGVPIARETDSATALESLLGCPFGWTMRQRARLRPGRFAEVAEEERLIGLLAHALAQELLLARTVPLTPGELALAAAARLPSLVEEAAAPLLHPGAAGELSRLLERLPRAMEAIGRLLVDGGYRVVATEAARDAVGLLDTGERLAGHIDLLLEDEEGRPALLDLKWTRRSRYYRDRLVGGNAIQLAAYSQLTGAGERAAYMLLADARAMGASAAMRGVEVVAKAPSLAATWVALRQSRTARGEALAAGHLHALGIYEGKAPPSDPDAASLAPAAPCHFCDFGRLCGKEQVA
jgi:ATP-dependent helicase/nuclease subunit B